MEGDCNESDLRFRHSISKIGGDRVVSLAVEPDPALKDSSLAEDSSDLSSLLYGRGGRNGDSTEDIVPTGILMECAGRFRPLVAPVMPCPVREGLADMKGPGFLGLSLNDEKQLGAVLILSSLTLPECVRCQEARDSPILLPRLTMGGGGP